MGKSKDFFLCLSCRYYKTQPKKRQPTLWKKHSTKRFVENRVVKIDSTQDRVGFLFEIH